MSNSERPLEIDESICTACERPHYGANAICGLCREQGRVAPVAIAPSVAPVRMSPEVPRYPVGWEAMQARFASRCPACKTEIRQGDFIGYLRAAREARHDRCVPRAEVSYVLPAAAIIAAATPTETVTPAITALRAAAQSIPLSQRFRQTAQPTFTRLNAPIRARNTSWAIVGEGESIGCVVLWAPLEGRSTTVGRLSDAWRTASLPDDWLLSGASDVAALGKAVSTAGNRDGLIARSIVGERGTWQIEAPVASAQVGEASRTLALRVKLAIGGGLTFEPSSHPMVPTIERDYAKIRNGAVSTSEIRNWLDSLVYKRLLGSGFGAHRGAYFIPGAAEKTFKRIQGVIAEALGGHDPLTMLPVGPVDQVKARVIESLTDDAKAVIAEVEQKFSTEIGTTGARSLIDKIEAAESRLKGYEGLIGAQVELRAKLAGFAKTLGHYARDAKGRYYTSDEAARFGGIWDELSREESKEGV